MCRYAFREYKAHFACFACRKAFKKLPIADWAKQRSLDYVYSKLLTYRATARKAAIEEELGTTYEAICEEYLESVSPCPQCGNHMGAMGLDFRAPRMNDVEAWEIISALYEHGFAFVGCGCSVGYRPPRKVSELEEFFAEHQRSSEGQKLLAGIRARMG